MPFRNSQPKTLDEALSRLEEFEQRFRSVLDNEDVGYFFIDSEGIILSVNQTWTRLYRYNTPQEIIGHHFAEIQRLDDLELAGKFVEGIMRGDEHFMKGEFSRKCKDGSTGFHSFSAKPVIREGKAIGIEGFIVDITPRKLAEQAALDMERRLQNLYNNMAEGVCLHEVLRDSNGLANNYKIVGINPQYESILGIKSGEVVGKLATEIYGTYDPPYLKTFLDVAETGCPAFFEAYFEPMDKYFSISVSPWGKDGFATIFTDITGRKRTEALLLESESKFRSVAETSPFGIMIYQDDHWVYSNPAGEEITGYTLEELSGMNFWENVAKPYRDEAIRNGKKRQEGMQEKISYEVQWISKSGQLKWVYVTGCSIVFGGKPAGMLSVVDISARKHMEQVLNDALDRAQESDRLKSAFLANMSHEIRTPMNAILGFSEMITDNDLLEHEKKRFAGIIKSSGDRLLQLISDIIDISKLEARQISINPEFCNPLEILNATAESFRNIASLRNKKNLQIRVEQGNVQAAAQYLVDVLRLHQVLDNLVGNAIKYTDAGQIIIGIELIEAAEGKLLHFYVKDTGIGIPREKQELIFERFRQAEEHGFREGAGLGLSISKGFVELMGGRIWVESEPGAGSCFHFTLPAAESGSKPVVRNLIKNLLVPDLRGKTLIIAEDDRDSYEFLQLLLEETGAIILRAENGNELLELIQARSPDLLMLDIRMPGKTGLQCLDIIRERGYNFKIIAQTAYALAEEQRLVISSGCHGYLSKPFTKQELFSCIHEVMAAGN